ncbi:MAG: chromosome segregation protein SMC [Promethearchaeia archaeon]
MVYIKSLICKGFKSFKERTKINFNKGFTSIVGANGSGKSNILDAFVFALGELSSNTMRVNNISDLICNGGKEGNPSKYARVDVIFENSTREIPVDSDSVKISRKINLDGRGKYYLNDKRTTRTEIRDILDLAGLMPNSTNLILQGELFRIINMNNDERRELIEDISGIATYNEKKEKAEKDLAKVEENISRITLLLNELSVQLDSLEKEKNDALKYQELDERQKNAKKALILLKVQKFDAEINEIKAHKKKLSMKIAQIKESIRNKRGNLGELTTKIDKVKRKINDLQSNELKELTMNLNELKTQVTETKTDLKNNKREKRRLEDSISEDKKKEQKLEEKSNKLKEELNEYKEVNKNLRETLKNRKEELKSYQDKIKEFDSEYEEHNKKHQAIIDRLEDKRSEKTDIESEIKVSKNKMENIHEHLKSKQNKIESIRKKIREIKKKIRMYEQKKAECNNQDGSQVNFAQLEKQKQKFNKKLKILREKIERKHTDLISLKSKLKAAKKYSNSRAVEAVLKIRDSAELQSKHSIHGRIYGTIAQLGKADQKYNTALQVAGGGRFNFIVVDNQQTAKECINYLKETNIGRASFIPLSIIRANPINLRVPTDDKVIGRAVDLIEFDPMFTKAFEYVFGRSVVVKDIDTATKLDVPASRVTLGGDIVNSSNLMTGGKVRKRKGRGFGPKAESRLPQLENQLNQMKQEENSIVNKLKEIEETITSNYKNRISSNNKINEIKQKLAILSDKIKDKDTELNELKQSKEEWKTKLTNVRSELDSLNQNLSEINSIIKKIAEEKQTIEEQMEQIQNNDFTKTISALRDKIESLEKKKMQSQLKITKIETQLKEITENQFNEIKTEISTLQSNLEENIRENEQLAQSLKKNKAKIGNLKEQIAEKNEIMGEIYAEKERLLKDQTDIKLAIEDLKASIHPKNLKINTLSTNLRNIETQKKELEQKHQLEEIKEKIEESEEFAKYLNSSQKKLKALIEDCKADKSELEPVNMRAIKKYDKIKNRYEDLINKHEVVVDERTAILEFIERIEMEKKRTFLQTFNGINKHFKRIFARLSPGGEAKLELENEEDPFEGGVKMLARPGGKKWCLTQSMSGGEKTLTVVALVLGIQIYIPSPYYILDEIDAAFDDHNASQVASLIKDLSEKSQFILITHRDVTMTKTDQLLGVSNVHGLTSVLNLNIQEAIEQIASS